MNKVINTALHRKRQQAERRFRVYGITALSIAASMLIILLGSILLHGLPGFVQTQIRLPITFDAKALSIASADELKGVPVSAYTGLIQASLRSKFTDVEEASQRELYAVVSPASGIILKRMLKDDPSRLDTSMDIWVPASSAIDQYMKTPDQMGKVTERQLVWLEQFRKEDNVRKVFNSSFLTQADSRTPEQAGFLGAMVGSALTLIICLLGVFPVGVMTAIYLEEFARKSKWVDLIEVNINNLAAVPSIVFGLLGLAVYINAFGMPRSAALVGGLTLALMILPVIIITTRVALKAVPDSIRDAARALGASPIQVVWHHTLPLSLPGIMTGTILGMARAIGETAPLLMIGMVAFVADTPTGFTSPATVMPVQIYLWASSPESGFAEKTASGILLLLVLLLAMNALAIFLRRRFEVRW